MKTLKSWTLGRRLPNGIELHVDGRHVLCMVALEDHLFRVSLKKDGAWRLPRTWSIAPAGDVPWEGRSRDDMSGFTCPTVEIDVGDTATLTTSCLRVTISADLHIAWAAKMDGAWQTFVQDRPTGGMLLGLGDHQHSHFLSRHADERVYGLGEKAGPLNRAGRRYEMRNLDAMGYDAQTTDPLYKHMPFTITQTATSGAWSLFYDNLANCWFDLGNELDNYHAPYRAYRAEDGDLDYYLRWAPRMLDLVKGQVRMTGGTCFMPRWSLGYSGSTMSYTDAVDAQAQLEGFVAQTATHQIACDSFQMSSGYTSIGAKRYVFNWNRDRVPDIQGLTKTFNDAGIHLVANIKPCLLQDHPRYQEAASAGLFIKDSETGAPEQSVFWDDTGSHLDFTNPDTIDWWKHGVATQLLDYGIGSTWNDNNEYEIWDRRAQCSGFGDPIDIALIRPLQSVLMTRASQEAQLAHAPTKRPYLICRSGAPGVQRYAQTWSGDNRTDWKTLRYNIRMGLGMSLSGLFNIGHDVGGFAGPRPDPELFVRWVQNGIFHPRFTIHSWNDDDTVNAPWMYPEVLGHVRQAMRLRYRLLPYIYTLLWQAAHHDEPMLRPLFLDHPDDPQSWDETDDFMLGRDLLVANIIDPGATSRRIRLPMNATGWWDFDSGQWHAPGAVITKDVDLATIPLFVRAGAVLPMSTGAQRADPAADTGRVLALFPVPGTGLGSGILFEDDGESRNAPFSLLTFTLSCNDNELALDWHQEGAGLPVLDRASLTLPQSERRRLTVKGKPTTPGETFSLLP